MAELSKVDKKFTKIIELLKSPKFSEIAELLKFGRISNLPRLLNLFTDY